MQSHNWVEPTPGERGEQALEEAFYRLLAEGTERLERPLLSLVATGIVGGIDVSVGVLAYLVVDGETGQPLLGAAAFTIGFVALLLARGELFTENFLVPVTARVAGRGSWFQLGRLWMVTLAANLVGGLAMTAMVVTAIPGVRPVAASLGRHYATLGISLRSQGDGDRGPGHRHAREPAATHRHQPENRPSRRKCLNPWASGHHLTGKRISARLIPESPKHPGFDAV